MSLSIAARAARSVLACVAMVAAAHRAEPADSPEAGRPAIHIEDVRRFYQVYDGADGHPSAEQLQRDYLDPGSTGLQQLASLRKVSGSAIAATLASHPQIYANARRCLAVLPRVRQRVQSALRRLGELYPEARFPPVTIAVSRGKPAGMTSAHTGVIIGLEALCAAEWMNPDVEERFVHVIAHEYVHAQQLAALNDDEHPTVLEAALVEGGAEFIAERISGDVGYSQQAAQVRGRESEIETAFTADEDSTDLSRWFYNSTLETPGDLGYWVGYRIVKAYYERTPDKRRAVRDIIEVTDPKLFLARSGWYPGMRLGPPEESPHDGRSHLSSGHATN